MSEEGEIWREYRKNNRDKKIGNIKKSLTLLKEKGIFYKELRGNEHVRVGEYDFWASTGKFYNQKTGEKGRGVFNLLKKITN